MNDRILRRAAVRAATGLPNTSLDRLEQEGRFPKRRRLTERSIGWSEREIQQWIEDRLNGGAA
jgi:prophage regulatory protein